MNNQITVVIIKNPFNINEREIKQVTHIPEEPVFHYVRTGVLIADTDVVISHNGWIVPEEEYNKLIPYPGDFIAVCPLVCGGSSGGKKNILSMVATIALSMVTMGVGSMAMGGSFLVGSANFAAASGWSFWASMAAMGTQYVGGQILSHWFPPPEPDLPETGSMNQSSTYGWGPIQSMQGQGNVVPITFGTIRTAGQIVAQHLTSDGEKQYLNVLLCGGEGPVNSIDGILLNDNSIGNYKDIGIDKRLGLNDQTVIPNFNDTFYDQTVGAEVVEDWTERTINGDVAEGLELTLEFPGGLYYMKNDGSPDTTIIRLIAEYQISGTGWQNPIRFIDHWNYPASRVEANSFAVNGDFINHFPTGKWITLVYNGGPSEVTVYNCFYDTRKYLYDEEDCSYKNPNYQKTVVTVSGSVPNNLTEISYENDFLELREAKNKPFRRTYRVDHIDPNQYDVRCKIEYRSGNGDRYINKVNWAGLTAIIYDDFERPNKVLLGIKALATDQLSGGMPTITWEQTRSQVWVWNPDAAEYQPKVATNPAWACYDLIHRCKKLKNLGSGVVEHIVEGVPASRIDYRAFQEWANFCDEEINGAKRCEVNILIDRAANLWDALKPIEEIGRGKVIIKGTRYSCICDQASDPVQLFNVSNIGLDSFSEEFTDAKDRATAIEVTFFNKERNYQRDTVTVYADGIDEGSAILNPTQITLYGCTDYKQAYREGMYRLRLNKYLTRTCSWSADIDAIACTIGDVVLIQHDVPHWGAGGRVIAATLNTVMLDKKVVLEPDTNYQIMVRLQDDTLVTKSVAQVPETTETDNLTLTTDFDVVPEEFDLYSFGEVAKVAKPFRVLSISRDGDFRRKITALEYVAEVYTEAEEIPVIDYTVPAPAIRNLKANERPDENFRIWVDLAWDPPRGGCFGARILVNGKQVGKTGMHETGFSYQADFPGIHKITVIATDIFGYDLSPVTIEYDLKGLDPPGDVTNLRSYYQNARTWLTWDPVFDFRPLDYEIRKGLTWSNSQYLGRTTDTKYQTLGDGLYWIAARWGGIYSQNPTGLAITGAELTSNVLVSHDEKIDGWQGTLSGGAAAVFYGTEQVVLLIGDIPPEEGDFGVIQPSGEYEIPTSNIVDLGVSEPCNIYANYEVFMDKPGALFSEVAQVSSLATVAGDYGAYGSAELQFALAGDDGNFRDWRTFVPGTYVGRKFKFKIILSSFDPEITTGLQSFTYVIDMPDRIDTGTSQTEKGTSETETEVNYDRPFHTVPNVQITLLEAEPNDFIKVLGRTEDGFRVQVINDTNVVGRTINWLAKGY